MAKGFYLTIGVNKIDSAFYTGPPLAGCVADANDYAEIAESQGFQRPSNFAGQRFATLVDEQAKRDRILSEIQAVAAQMSGDDIFLLQFSGHGMETKALGLNAKDDDTFWCTYDKPLPDKFLFNAWFSFPNKSRILLISDSCHSGTMLKTVGKRDLGGRQNQEKTRAANAGEFAQLSQQIENIVAATKGRTPDAGVLLLSGCQDNELSGDGATNGLFTEALKQVWDNGAFNGDYRKFHQAIAAKVSQAEPTQNPNRAQVGNSAVIGNFPLQRPFQV
jgi:metacaspase-1